MPASIFLSYASEDRLPARSIGDALTKLGIEVWLDESELGGGDAWDQKIRRQIRDCDYFMPIVSAQTEARHEGYFRREWRLAVERTLDMADDHLFLLPVVIDGTDQAHARVPEKFLAVQWLKVPGGEPTPTLEALSRRILSGDTGPAPAQTKPARQRSADTGRAAPLPYPPFPHEEPGQRMRFWAHVLGWMVRCTWMAFSRLPRWIRICIYVWFAVVVMSRGCTPSSHDRSEHLSPAEAQKLKAIAERYKGSTNPDDIAKLGTQIAGEFSKGAAPSAGKRPVLAVPFSAPNGDSAAEKLTDDAFAQTYGRLSVSHRGQVSLDKNSYGSADSSGALKRAREEHADYVVYGAVGPKGPAQALTVTIFKVQDGSVVWTQAYPVATADAEKIAEEVDAKVPSSDSDDD